MSSLFAKIAFLAQTAPAAGAPAASSEQQGSGNFPVMILMYGLLFGGFYFMFIRPQQKKAKETAQKQSSLKTGDKVATAAGIIGKVVTIEDNTVTLEVSSGVRIPFLRTAITEFLSDEPAKA